MVIDVSTEATHQFVEHTPTWLPVSGRFAPTAVAVGIGSAVGVCLGVAMPRGPMTASQVLVTIALCLIAGLAMGLATAVRWPMLTGPVAMLAVFELTRIDTDGPLVDGVHLDTSWGVAAFVLGRGVNTLLAVVPLVLGVVWGAAYARRYLCGEPTRHGWRRVLAALRTAVAIGTTVALVAFVVALTRPASTPAIVDAAGHPVPGSIASLEQIELGGAQQWITMRGNDTDAPVLLHLAGGPGQSDLGYIRALWGEMEQDLVVVDWDQRGSGKSYPALEPTETLTLEQAVDDTIELTEYLVGRFDEKKIYLIGESWGTILGTLAVQRRPDLYYAYIGGGQMVDVTETDRLLYEEMLGYAERVGDDDIAKKMHSFGQPPYDDVFANAYVMSYYDELNPHSPPAAYEDAIGAGDVGPLNVMASEYTLIERVNVVRGLADMFAVMYPQLQQIDFRVDVPRLEVPVYLLDARHEAAARRDLSNEWFEDLEAPIKRTFAFAHSGHSAQYEEAGRLHHLLVTTILPETYVSSEDP